MLSKTFNCFKDTITAQDKFAKHIQLKIHNKSSVKSFLGGFLTLCIQFGILSYLIIQLIQVWDHQEIKIIQSIFERNLLTDNYEVKLNEKNFDLALYLSFSGQNNTIAQDIDTYVSLQVFSIVSETAQKGELYNTSAQFATMKWTLTPVPLTRCTPDRMGGPGYSDTMAGLYWCPKNVNFTLQGHYQTNNKNIQIRFTYCDQSILDTYLPGKKCKSKQEIDQIINMVGIRLAMLTQFADLRAFGDERIKKTLTAFDNGFTSIMGQAVYFKVSENTVKFKDSIISNTLSNEDFSYINVKLFQLSGVSTSIRPGFIGSYLLFMDEEVKISQRTVQTVFDVFAQCGGLLGTLTVFCSILVSRFEEFKYQQHLIQSLYSVFDKNAFKKIENKLRSQNSCENNIDKKELILTDIKSRVPLFIGLKEWIIFKSCFKNKLQKQRSDIINTALKKLNKELDIVQLIKANRDFKNILKLTLSKQFKQLLRLSKESLINPKIKNENQSINKQKTIDAKIDKIFKDKDKRKNKKLINILFEGVNRHSLALIDDKVDNPNQTNGVDELLNSQRQLGQSSRLQLLDFKHSSTVIVRKKKQSTKLSKKKVSDNINEEC